MGDIAATIAGIPQTEAFKASRRRDISIDRHVERFFDELRSAWSEREFSGVYDLFPTIWDATDTRQLVNLPEYQHARPRVLVKGETRISDENRHGEVINIFANNDTHSFGILIKDYNVAQVTLTGKRLPWGPRNFLILGDDGEWYPGSPLLEIQLPDERFLSRPAQRNLPRGLVRFEDFSTHELWRAFHGQRYWNAHVLRERLRDEEKSAYKRAEDLELLLDYHGLSLPLGVDGTVKKVYGKEEGETFPVGIVRMNTKLQTDPIVDEYPWFGISEEGGLVRYGNLTENQLLHGLNSKDHVNMVRFYDNRKRDLRRTRQRLQAYIRTVDRAMFKYGFDDDYEEMKDPGWLVGKIEERHNYMKGGWREWNAITAIEPREHAPYDGGLRLLFRIKPKTVRLRKEVAFQDPPPTQDLYIG